MPLITSSYKSSPFYFNGHLETILPGIFRKVNNVHYTRERIHTPDDDFLDLDWIKNGSKKLVIISHGLEGSSDRPYMLGMAKIFANHGYDVLAWNFRGCSGEINHQLRFYHSGATDDLHTVLQHACAHDYEQINMIGFSLGGNMTLKYLGEQKDNLAKQVNKAVVYSVPLNLHGSSVQISKPENILYSKRFLRNLKKKIKQKALHLPDQLDKKGIAKINSLVGFDDRYTAPIHGFKDALDYYHNCSAIKFVDDIKIPTLIVNALNDSFLSDNCYPYEQLEGHPLVYLETPKRGGHCGFPGTNKDGQYWSETRALEFIQHEVEEVANR